MRKSGVGPDPRNHGAWSKIKKTLCQNEADVKFQMDINSHISITEHTQGPGVTQCPLEIFTSASFWQRGTTALF